MGIDTAISTMQALAADYPFLALALILFTAAMFVKGKWGVILGLLGLYALLQQFGLVGAFIDLFKSALDFVKNTLAG